MELLGSGAEEAGEDGETVMTSAFSLITGSYDDDSSPATTHAQSDTEEDPPLSAPFTVR